MPNTHGRAAAGCAVPIHMMSCTSPGHTLWNKKTHDLSIYLSVLARLLMLLLYRFMLVDSTIKLPLLFRLSPSVAMLFFLSPLLLLHLSLPSLVALLPLPVTLPLHLLRE